MNIQTNERGEGFHITFSNNCTISVQWGERNSAVAGESVEIAAWRSADYVDPVNPHKRTKYIHIHENDGFDPMRHYVPIDEIGHWISKIQKLPS